MGGGRVTAAALGYNFVKKLRAPPMAQRVKDPPGNAKDTGQEDSLKKKIPWRTETQLHETSTADPGFI